MTHFPTVFEKETGRHLADPSQRSLKLRRERARSSLVEALNRVGAFSEDEAPFLVISGEPDVGKSALTLDAVEEGGKLRSLATRLLRDCHNLAMPGLVVGTLVRHIDLVDDELDDWLSQPELWPLEFSRVAKEMSIHVQGPETKNTRGGELRRWSFREAAASLTANAVFSDDQERVTVLRECGRLLMRRARHAVADVDPDDGSHDHESEELTTVAGWASALEAGNYVLRWLDDGIVDIQYQPPASIREAFQVRNAALGRGQQVYRLVQAYILTQAVDRNSIKEAISDDLRLARSLAEDPPDCGLDPEVAPAAVAAAGILAHLQESVSLNQDELHWASELIVKCAISPRLGPFAFEQTLNSLGADRSVAAVLPALLVLSARDEPGVLPREQVEEALVASSTSLFDEVRQITATALRLVWDSDCTFTTKGGQLPSNTNLHGGMKGVLVKAARRVWHAIFGSVADEVVCIHKIALDATGVDIRDRHLGTYGYEGQRAPSLLGGPIPETTGEAVPDAPMISHLVAPIIASGDAAASLCCVRDTARELFGAFLEAYSLGAILWAERDYDRNGHIHIARVLFSYAASGESSYLIKCLQAYAGHPVVLYELLYDLCELATYDDKLRASLPVVWPFAMATLFDEFDAGAYPHDDRRDSSRAISQMLPHPVLSLTDRDSKASIDNANSDWIDPDLLAGLVARWIPLARGSPECVDALVALVRTGAPTWQASIGLGWVNNLIEGSFKQIAGQSFYLTDWLQDLRSAGHLDARASTTAQQIVDGLAMHGDMRAVALQRAEE